MKIFQAKKICFKIFQAQKNSISKYSMPQKNLYQNLPSSKIDKKIKFNFQALKLAKKSQCVKFRELQHYGIGIDKGKGNSEGKGIGKSTSEGKDKGNSKYERKDKGKEHSRCNGKGNVTVKRKVM